MLELNQLYNTDCLEAMKQFPDKHFELAIVDPQYGIGESLKKEKTAQTGGNRHPKQGIIRKTGIASHQRKSIFDELFRVSQNQIIWGGNYFIDKIKTPSMGVDILGQEKRQQRFLAMEN